MCLDAPSCPLEALIGLQILKTDLKIPQVLFQMPQVDLQMSQAVLQLPKVVLQMLQAVL